MTRAILLDIDDVISTDRSILACREFDEDTLPGYRVPRVGDRVALELINRACTICAAKLVVSSSWLDIVGPSYTLSWLVANGLIEENLWKPDPCVKYGRGSSKRMAIEDWRAQNGGVRVEDIVVIDDDGSLFPKDHPLAPRQVVIDGENGIMLGHYRLITAKLGATDRAAGVFGGLRAE